MNTYLLTWNPRRWQWDLDAELASIKKKGFVDATWSCGNSKRLEPGNRVYILKQRVEPRGIIASGEVTSNVYERKHWDSTRPNEIARYVDCRLDALVDPERVLPVSQLKRGSLDSVNWRTQSSGISITPAAAAKLDQVWRAFLAKGGQAPAVLPEEVPTPSLYYEGASRTISVNAYERDPRARKACIDHYGASCAVCDFDFGKIYGKLGKGFIHVHHLKPLSRIGKSYRIDPIRDLRPVCPNCHAMLHAGNKVISIDQLKKAMR